MSGSNGIGARLVSRDSSSALSAADDQNASGSHSLTGMTWNNNANMTFSFATSSAAYGPQKVNGS